MLWFQPQSPTHSLFPTIQPLPIDYPVGDAPGLPSANPEYQDFPDVPEKVGGGVGYHEQLPSEEYMDIANNVALSKHYAYLFMKDWPLYVGGTAVALYLIFRR